MYYASLATNKLIVLDGSNEEDYHLKIFKARKGEKGKWDKPEALSMEINREDFHTGNVKISPDGQAMYFTRAEIDPSTNAVTSSKIYVSTRSEWPLPSKTSSSGRIIWQRSTLLFFRYGRW